MLIPPIFMLLTSNVPVDRVPTVRLLNLRVADEMVITPAETVFAVTVLRIASTARSVLTFRELVFNVLMDTWEPYTIPVEILFVLIEFAVILVATMAPVEMLPVLKLSNVALPKFRFCVDI